MKISADGCGKRPGTRPWIFRPLLILLWLPFLLPATLQAEDLTLRLSDGDVWKFAETLLRQGEYYRAISEYRRLTHFFPKSRHTGPAGIRIGEALLRGGEPRQAIAHLNTLTSPEADAGGRDRILYLRGLSWLELERERPYALREAAIASGLEDFRAISSAFSGHAAVKGFLDSVATPPELPTKSPWLAGTLSTLVPGAGSFYVGRYSEGSLAFFMTSVLIYGTMNAIEEKKEGLGLVLGTLGLAFYGGSILAATNGAHKFNDHARDAWLTDTRRKFGIVINRGGLGGAFRQSF